MSVRFTMNMSKDEILGELRKLGLAVEPCGSMVTCSPPPSDTDEDFLVELSRDHQWSVVGDVMKRGGLYLDGLDYSNGAEQMFQSWKSNLRHDLDKQMNFIITSDFLFAARHRLATKICKRLNLMNKADRIAVFHGVLYDNWKEG